MVALSRAHWGVNVGRSSSAGQLDAPGRWLFENLNLFMLRWRGRAEKASELLSLFDDIESYETIYRRWTGRELKGARIFEIGYGGRPNRLIALMSLGYDARGIDIDFPILGGSAELIELAKRNGARRFIKTAVRHLIFDRQERAALNQVLRQRSRGVRIDRSRFLVGDACDLELPPQSLDFIYSEDVFEHVDRAGIGRLCRKMRDWLSSDGIAVITPAVFTGIQGGHLTEWFDIERQGDRHRLSEPWEHLRKRRFKPDCYLNELRIAEYRQSFEVDFDILHEEGPARRLGGEYLTDEIRAELSGYGEDELMTNRLTFVLRPKQRVEAG